MSDIKQTRSRLPAGVTRVRNTATGEVAEVPRAPARLIRALRESDRHIVAIFTQGGCYRFAVFLQSVFPGSVVMINSGSDHAAALIDGRLYDITGEIDGHGWRRASSADLNIMERWSFDRHHLLAVGECPHCGEPVFPLAATSGRREAGA